MHVHKLIAPSKVKLDDLATEPPKGVTREKAADLVAKLGAELFELQDLMWGARTHAVLVVLQGRDTAGKDGAIKNVVGYLNPRGVAVTSFGVPTLEEREHDFLWRVHGRAPRKGEFSIFNRSHYEDVLVVRVHGLVPAARWKERYGHINDFEETLTEEGTIILKYFLHIAKREQKERLVERERDPRTAWKLNIGDWKEREHWRDYTKAYEDAIVRCSHPRAPWNVVPADSKWFRNLAIAESIVTELRPYREEWERVLAAKGKEGKAELAAWRKATGRSAG